MGTLAGAAGREVSRMDPPDVKALRPGVGVWEELRRSVRKAEDGGGVWGEAEDEAEVEECKVPALSWARRDIEDAAGVGSVSPIRSSRLSEPLVWVYDGAGVVTGAGSGAGVEVCAMKSNMSDFGGAGL